MSEHQPVDAENDELRPGRLFEHIVYTTGYNGPDGPEAVIFEITEVTDDGKVYYGPAQRGIETVATLWIWEHLFERDALRSWVGERPLPHGRGAFYEDHDADMQDPEYREAFEQATRVIAPEGTDPDNPIIHRPGCSWETTPHCDCGADPERALPAAADQGASDV